jgi:two-component system response regulator DevR
MTQNGTAPIRVLLVDDHEVVRIGLRTLLSQQPGIEVIAEAATMAAAVAETARCEPDLVLLDVRLPDGSGFDACRQIRNLGLDTRVLILTSFADDDTVLQSIQAGADGYLLKEINAATLTQAIRDVASGKSILDPAVTRKVMEQAKSLSSTAKDKMDRISPQEQRVLALVAQGKTNKEIGLDLGLSDKTVKNYLSNALDKLQLSRRSQAAAFFAQHHPH